MTDYVLTLRKAYPEVPFYVKGPRDDYASLRYPAGFVGPTKAELDLVALDAYKEAKNDAIDARTQELIAAGFDFEGNTFSLSMMAQMNWVALNSARDDLTFPVAVSTKDNQEVTFANATRLHTFCMTALAAGKAHYDSGRALKLAVNGCVDIAAVDTINDAR